MNAGTPVLEAVFIADFRVERSTRIIGFLEGEAEAFAGEPGDGAAVVVEAGLGDEGVVGSAVERDEELVAPDGEMAASLDKLAIGCLGSIVPQVS